MLVQLCKAMNSFKCCSNCKDQNTAANHLSVSDYPATGLIKNFTLLLEVIPPLRGFAQGTQLPHATILTTKTTVRKFRKQQRSDTCTCEEGGLRPVMCYALWLSTHFSFTMI